MDRDYTTQAEVEYTGCIHQLESINHQLEFSTMSDASDISSVFDYSQIHADIVANNAASYFALMDSGLNVFEKVRRYDSGAAAQQTIQDELEDFRIRLQAVRSLMKIPPLGHTVQEINYNLGRYGRDTALAGSIFGDSLCYAETVEAIGFVEQAENSRAYYERALAAVIFIDENGNVTYDMAVIERILAKDAGDITNAEYAVIATAYLYMNEADMETLFCNMMTLSEQKDYGWMEENVWGPWFGDIREDYYEWSIDDEKWNGFTQGLHTVSLYNLAAICACQSDYPEAADAAADWRYNIVQREAIANAMCNVHEFRAPYGADRPYLEIARTEDEHGNAQYNIGFREYYEITASYGERLSSNTLHASEVHIGTCNPGISSQFITTDHVCIALHGYFAPYFTSEGFASPEAEQAFISEHILGFVMHCGQEAVESNAYGDVLFVGSLVNDVIAVVGDYAQGIQDAAMIEMAADELKEENVYSYFDCDVVIVSYDTYDISGESLYADAGQYTVQIIKEYNNRFKENITVNQIIQDPLSVHDILQYQSENGGGDDLHDIHFGDWH